MAVEAPHMNLFPSQFLTNSEVIKHNNNNNNLSNAAELLSYNGQMDSTVIPLPLPLPLPLPVPSSATMAEPLLPFYPSAVCDLASAKTSMNKSVDSGLTCHNIPPTRKRPRDLIAESIPHAAKINKFSSESSSSSSFLDQDILYQIQNQQSEIDLFISQYTEKLRMELEKQRVRQSRTLLSGIQEAMVKKLKEKDEEIQRMGKMNWMLQERAKSLCVENQIWRELAQTNEATANSLRSNLEQVLAHVADDHLHTSAGAGAGPEVPEDVESCCGSNYDDDDDDQERRDFTAANGGDTAATGRMCRKCGVREAIVLLLPCRHLCVCTMCGSMVRNCPVCDSRMNASVHVNFS